MLARAIERAEMGEEQRVGIPAEDLRLALAPQFEIDVGGGDAGMTYFPLPRRIPAVSPTKAMRVDGSK